MITGLRILGAAPLGSEKQTLEENPEDRNRREQRNGGQEDLTPGKN